MWTGWRLVYEGIGVVCTAVARIAGKVNYQSFEVRTCVAGGFYVPNDIPAFGVGVVDIQSGVLSGVCFSL